MKQNLVLKIGVDTNGHRYHRWVSPDKTHHIPTKGQLDVEKEKHKGYNTAEYYKDESGFYDSERLKLHNKIKEKYLNKAGKTDKLPTVVMMGDGMAGGKSTMVNNFIQPSIKQQRGEEMLLVDVDEIKKEIPEYVDFQKEDVSSAAERVHKESSDIGKYVFQGLVEKKKSFIFDGTMKNTDRYIRLVQKLKKAGYQIQIFVATTSIEEAKKRAMRRGKETGRFVPMNDLVKSHASTPVTFERIKNIVDSYYVYDTTDKATLIATNKSIIDKQKYKAFLDKQKYLVPTQAMEQIVKGYEEGVVTDSEFEKARERKDEIVDRVFGLMVDDIVKQEENELEEEEKTEEELEEEETKKEEETLKGEKAVKEATKHKDVLGEGAKKRKKLEPKDKVSAVMKEFKQGTLHSGSGEKVTDRKQAVAIALETSGLSKAEEISTILMEDE